MAKGVVAIILIAAAIGVTPGGAAFVQLVLGGLRIVLFVVTGAIGVAFGWGLLRNRRGGQKDRAVEPYKPTRVSVPKSEESTAPQQEGSLKCTKCGGAMILRQPPPGKSWKAFWGCASFPKCWGKQSF